MVVIVKMKNNSKKEVNLNDYSHLFKNKLMKDPVLKRFAADKKHIIKLKTIIIEKVR